ncbi:MAG TPA: hypothetical protein VGP19_00935 [Candidatus Acidoferrales bacterium]|nr:hypothetical protein [Candidatus Acidoferrales bacterium]
MHALLGYPSPEEQLIARTILKSSKSAEARRMRSFVITIVIPLD